MRTLIPKTQVMTIHIICSSDWLYANEFVLGVRNCRGKKNFASGVTKKKKKKTSPKGGGGFEPLNPPPPAYAPAP